MFSSPCRPICRQLLLPLLSSTPTRPRSHSRHRTTVEILTVFWSMSSFCHPDSLRRLPPAPPVTSFVFPDPPPEVLLRRNRALVPSRVDWGGCDWRKRERWVKETSTLFRHAGFRTPTAHPYREGRFCGGSDTNPEMSFEDTRRDVRTFPVCR